MAAVVLVMVAVAFGKAWRAGKPAWIFLLG
jgi:hypothetical protein